MRKQHDSELSWLKVVKWPSSPLRLSMRVAASAVASSITSVGLWGFLDYWHTDRVVLPALPVASGKFSCVCSRPVQGAPATVVEGSWPTKRTMKSGHCCEPEAATMYPGQPFPFAVVDLRSPSTRRLRRSLRDSRAGSGLRCAAAASRAADTLQATSRQGGARDMTARTTIGSVAATSEGAQPPRSGRRAPEHQIGSEKSSASDSGGRLLGRRSRGSSHSNRR